MRYGDDESLGQTKDFGLIMWNKDVADFGSPNMDWMGAKFGEGRIVWFCPSEGQYERRHNIDKNTQTFPATEALNDAIANTETVTNFVGPELVSSHYENGETNLVIKHPMIAAIAQSIAEYYDDSGASNFVEMRYVHTPSNREFVMNIQRVSGKTPWEILDETKLKLKDLEEKYAKLEADYGALSSKLGNKDEY